MSAAAPIRAGQTDELEENGLLLAARLMEELCGGAVPVVSAQDFVAGVIRAFGHGQALAINLAAGRRTCRVCGCWDLHACDGGCAWAGEDICTACHPNGGEHKEH